MSKRFKVEHNDMEKGVLYITLHNPPYNDEDILSKVDWKLKDVIITEVHGGEKQ
tara:strand:- start:462 stop:623 length:162 start_codon:yes stop_codon:yes gene_type:complete